MSNIRVAGFYNVSRFAAVDALNDDLHRAWGIHGHPKISDEDSFHKHIGEQGCALSHLNIWKHIMDTQIPAAVIFEDDVRFHSSWESLAVEFFDQTPKDYHILYMGSQLSESSDERIVKIPLYCTHAYIITLEGARVLYNYVLQHTSGFYAIDCMLYDGMKSITNPFIWYAWNGMMYPDDGRGINHHWTIRNSGLVFQDENAGTMIKPR